jgi:ADP-dependent NAD(P)H-hydrate dehydratase
MNRVAQLKPLPARPADGHKGTFGRVLVIGGNDQMIGAPAFCALAAYHTGAGYVQVAAPRAALLAVLTLVPQAIGLALPGGDLDAAIDKATVIAAGPGLGQLGDAGGLVDRTLAGGKPAVLDADALNLIAARGAWPEAAARCVLTPHPGEMKRLGPLFGKPDQTGGTEADRVDTALRAAQAFGQVVVFKGHRTVVTDGHRVYVNRTGGPALAKAGSGDILSGMLAALLAQSGVDPFDAACTAVWTHGKAGEIAADRVGERSVTSPDVLHAIGPALAAYANVFG